MTLQTKQMAQVVMVFNCAAYSVVLFNNFILLDLRMTGSDSSGNLRPTVLFPQASPGHLDTQAGEQHSVQVPPAGLRRGNSNLHTIIEKDVEVDTPIKAKGSQPSSPNLSSKYFEGNPTEPSSFDEDDDHDGHVQLNLADREKVSY